MKNYEIILYVTGKNIKVHMTAAFKSMWEARQYAVTKYMFTEPEGVSLKFSCLEVRKVA